MPKVREPYRSQKIVLFRRSICSDTPSGDCDYVGFSPGAMHRFILIAAPPVAAPQHGLAADSYAARALRRRFDDLDGTRDGMLDEAEARAALGHARR